MHFLGNSQRAIQVPKPTDVTGKEAEKMQKDEQKKIDNAVPLTEEDLLERDELLKDGLSGWSRRDFTQFVKASEKHGREDIDNIAAELAESKTKEEVVASSVVET